MPKQPVELRQQQAKKAFLQKLDNWIKQGLHADFRFSTQNGVICNDIEINLKEKLGLKNK